MAHDESESKVPVLVAPRGEAVIDGNRVVFEWEPLADGGPYILQIADDSSFETPLYEAKTERATQLVVEDVLPIDERTYYWRVLVTDADGEAHGQDTIESFISGSASTEDLELGDPDHDEEFGPGTRLLRGAGAEVAAAASSDPQYVEEEAEMGVQHEGIEAGQILGFILATVVALGLAIFTLTQYFGIVEQAARNAAAGASGYPELREVELESTRHLSRYDVIDAQGGVYQIPIDRAIELMANEARESPADSYSSELDLLPEDQ